MAIDRAKLVDLTVTRWFHRVSRCVRKAYFDQLSVGLERPSISNRNDPQSLARPVGILV
jgi:hypothetical protein